MSQILTLTWPIWFNKRMAKLVKDDRTGVIHYLRTAGETYADKFAIACTSRPLSMVCEPYADETGPTCKRCLALKRE